MLPRRSPILLASGLVLLLGLGACGSDGGATQVAAGSGAAASSTTSVAAAPPPDASSTTTAPTDGRGAATTTMPTSGSGSTAGPTTTTTTTVEPPAGPSDPSPVAGLSADELRAALDAPARGASRSVAGPSADQVVLPDGTRVWRVRIPGAFQVRSARVTILVGDRTVGIGVVASDLGSITAVTADGSGLRAGQPVSYQWEGGPRVAAGTLAVVR